MQSNYGVPCMGNYFRFSDSFSLTHAEKCTKLDVFMIIDGIARGMQYMHEDSHARITHRDLKDTNVLLNSNLKPKILDFGLARVLGGDGTKKSEPGKFLGPCNLQIVTTLIIS